MKLRGRLVFVPFFLLASGFAATGLQVQPGSGTLSGTVTDRDRRTAISGAEVKIMDLASGAFIGSSVTDDRGSFRIPSLPPGHYAVSVRADGFRASGFRDIVLDPNTQVTVAIDLERVMGPPVPFPEVRNWNSVRITLVRSPCFGACPAYRVEVRGDGSVIYDGGDFVALKGRHRASVPRETVRQLVAAFRDADYYSLLDSYFAGVTDAPSFGTSIKIDGRSKTVDDYFGQHIGMPAAVTKVEEAIDRLAGAARWTRGNAETVASLRRERWSFKSAEAAATLARVAQFGNVDVVRDLIAAGVPLSGGNPREGTPLASAAASGIPDLVKLFLQFQPNVNAADADGETALMRAGRPNRYPGATEPPKGGRAEVVRLLLAAGADVNAHSKHGRTALMIAGWDADVALLLIKAGSSVNAQDKEGYTPLMSAAAADVARVLLDNGADPTMRNAEGKSALDLARELGREEVVALLQAAMAGHQGR